MGSMVINTKTPVVRTMTSVSTCGREAKQDQTPESEALGPARRQVRRPRGHRLEAHGHTHSPPYRFWGHNTEMDSTRTHRGPARQCRSAGTATDAPDSSGTGAWPRPGASRPLRQRVSDLPHLGKHTMLLSNTQRNAAVFLHSTKP